MSHMGWDLPETTHVLCDSDGGLVRLGLCECRTWVRITNFFWYKFTPAPQEKWVSGMTSPSLPLVACETLGGLGQGVRGARCRVRGKKFPFCKHMCLVIHVEGYGRARRARYDRSVSHVQRDSHGGMGQGARGTGRRGRVTGPM